MVSADATRREDHPDLCPPSRRNGRRTEIRSPTLITTCVIYVTPEWEYWSFQSPHAGKIQYGIDHESDNTSIAVVISTSSLCFIGIGWSRVTDSRPPTGIGARTQPRQFHLGGDPPFACLLSGRGQGSVQGEDPLAAGSGDMATLTCSTVVGVHLAVTPWSRSLHAQRW